MGLKIMKIRIYNNKHLEHFHKNNFDIEDVRKSRYLQEKLLRPGYHDTFTFRFLKDDIHEWLIENNIQYSIGWDNSVWCIDIEDKSKMMLFKLIWY